MTIAATVIMAIVRRMTVIMIMGVTLDDILLGVPLSVTLGVLLGISVSVPLEPIVIVEKKSGVLNCFGGFVVGTFPGVQCFEGVLEFTAHTLNTVRGRS